jgi:transcriptional regulator with XRE-family HTH domain
MLTGNQIAAARRVAGFTTQSALAAAASVSCITVARTEAAKDELPAIGVDALAKIVRALEVAGVEFRLDPGSSFIGGLGMWKRQP